MQRKGLLLGVTFFVLLTIPHAGAAEPPALPVPQEKDQILARRRIVELYAADLQRTEEKFKRELVDRLRAEARNNASDSPLHYMLLRTAFEKSIEARDLQSGMSVALEMGAVFDVNWRAMHRDVITRVGPTWTVPESNQRLTRFCFIVADSAITRDDYESAIAVLRIAEIAVRKSKNFADGAELERRAKRVQLFRAEHEKYTRAIARLERAPEDPAANLAAGRFLCFVKGRWSQGLAMLARGTDTRLKHLAERDLAGPETAEDGKSLAEAWWEASMAHDGAIGSRLRERATHWYRQTLVDLSGADAERAKARLSEAQATDELSTRRPTDAVQFEANHYLLLNLHADWLLAKHLCEEMGGHLVCIGNERENEFLVSLMKDAKTNEAHIGLSDDAEEGNWEWINGEPRLFTRWDTRQPDGGRRQNYAILRVNGLWDDTGGGPLNRAFICEWPADAPADEDEHDAAL
jgi:hypothetical protein